MVWRCWRGIDLAPRATLQRPLPREVVMVSRAALKGSEGREFDTPALECNWEISHGKDFTSF